MPMSTSKEEIALQHQEAIKILEIAATSSCPTLSEPICFTEEIPLKDKERPVIELNKEELHQLKSVWSSRGHVNVHALQELVREGYNQIIPTNADYNTNNKNGASNAKQQSATNKAAAPKYTAADVKSITNLWDPINAAVNNVAIRRPSHDAWGINKIILVFADDFLQDIYELPWWHARSDIREAVQPILDLLNISNDRIVRLLLASLPPGVTIPIHSDSGAWVKQTHRVHVPILVNDVSKILFRCGAFAESLQRIDVSPGHVFEINNQALHAVSNCDIDHRVHLILDYTDTVYDNNRVKLQPGEILLQTRRSIDRWQARGQRPTPTFIILGAQKAGTTSLYEYIVQHPLVIRAKRRETHCFDWRWKDGLTNVQDQRQHCQSFYYFKELFLHPSCLTGDSTPSYLLDSLRVIPRMQRVFDWPSLLLFVVLRHPVQRAASHYAMVTSTEGTPEQLKSRGSEWRCKTIEQVVHSELKQLQSCGLIPYWNIETGAFDQSIWDGFVGSKDEEKAWKKHLQSIPLNTGSHNLIARGLYALNLQPWLQAFERKRFLILSLDRLKDDLVGVMNDVWDHLKIPDIQIADAEPKNTRDYEPLMTDSLEVYLKRFYKPHNERLERLLGPEWKGCWSE